MKPEINLDALIEICDSCIFSQVMEANDPDAVLAPCRTSCVMFTPGPETSGVSSTGPEK